MQDYIFSKSTSHLAKELVGLSVLRMRVRLVLGSLEPSPIHF